MMMTVLRYCNSHEPTLGIY